MQLVFAAVEYELFWITTFDLAKLTSYRLAIADLWSEVFLLTSIITSLVATHYWMRTCRCSLIVQLVLQLESSHVVLLPESSVPVFVNSTWEHQGHLRYVSEIVSLALHNPDDVLFSTLTESKLFLGFVFSRQFLFFVIDVMIELYEVSVFSVINVLECLFDTHFA